MLTMLDTDDLFSRILNLREWMRIAKQNPNVYANVQMVSKLSSEIINDLVEERGELLEEIDLLTIEMRAQSHGEFWGYRKKEIPPYE
ncbi:MAG TPA: hypothetical protein PLW50_00565 [Smithellaceae bacterium]|nr:hypothetical protein [Smithellaceae bacterium]